MNDTIKTIIAHRSVRKFKSEPLTEETIHTLVQSAQAASTSSYIQAYSIIGVTDPDKKKQFSQFAGSQEYVAENGHFFVFCADLHRHDWMAKRAGEDISEMLDSTEKFMVACIDAALAAQNMAIAAESMGLGLCYIGGIRNNLEEVTKILETPDRVLPLFGMAIGVPAKETSQKPRLPRAHVYHENTYKDEHYEETLQEYDDIIQSYYTERTKGKRTDTWSEQMVRMLSNPTRMYMKEFVEKKGFNKR
ncbi:oxygen-insensitive NADPH nitroreductase [Bacillus fonticola]|uniref:oxygen-insensitive NADPH nitroreductase n=1 Tax=Bacillus fonticola TaxID=2728853 RepID=UPI00147589CF|nr:oxygen-insensitive NADPH nitroreductase [Bacillus fonticola]